MVGGPGDECPGAARDGLFLLVELVEEAGVAQVE